MQVVGCTMTKIVTMKPASSEGNNGINIWFHNAPLNIYLKEIAKATYLFSTSDSELQS